MTIEVINGRFKPVIEKLDLFKASKMTSEQRQRFIERTEIFIKEETERLSSMNHYLENVGIPNEHLMMEAVWRLQVLEDKLESTKAQLERIKQAKDDSDRIEKNKILSEHMLALNESQLHEVIQANQENLNWNGKEWTNKK